MQATQAEQNSDKAIEQFNSDMSNAASSTDREEATRTLARSLGSLTEAVRIHSAWMAQQDQAALEARQ